METGVEILKKVDSTPKAHPCFKRFPVKTCCDPCRLHIQLLSGCMGGNAKMSQSFIKKIMRDRCLSCERQQNVKGKLRIYNSSEETLVHVHTIQQATGWKEQVLSTEALPLSVDQVLNFSPSGVRFKSTFPPNKWTFKSLIECAPMR